LQSRKTIEINADAGEGSRSDPLIMPFISSCSIACGGHAGEEQSIRETIRLAKQQGVKCGAHFSLPDRANFGRKMIAISPSELKFSLQEQLHLFLKISREENVFFHHVKAHGALYTHGAEEKGYVKAMREALLELPLRPIVFLQKNSLLYREIKDHLPVWQEAFIDRRYAESNKLLSRKHPQALITDKEEAWQQLINIYENQKVRDVEGNEHNLQASTFCIHGDSPRVVQILEYIHRQLKKREISLA
jgi:UPF0271 protein